MATSSLDTSTHHASSLSSPLRDPPLRHPLGQGSFHEAVRGIFSDDLRDGDLDLPDGDLFRRRGAYDPRDPYRSGPGIDAPSPFHQRWAPGRDARFDAFDSADPAE